MGVDFKVIIKPNILGFLSRSVKKVLSEKSDMKHIFQQVKIPRIKSGCYLFWESKDEVTISVDIVNDYNKKTLKNWLFEILKKCPYEIESIRFEVS